MRRVDINASTPARDSTAPAQNAVDQRTRTHARARRRRRPHSVARWPSASASAPTRTTRRCRRASAGAAARRAALAAQTVSAVAQQTRRGAPLRNRRLSLQRRQTPARPARRSVAGRCAARRQIATTHDGRAARAHRDAHRRRVRRQVRLGHDDRHRHVGANALQVGQPGQRTNERESGGRERERARARCWSLATRATPHADHFLAFFSETAELASQ